MLVLLIRKSGEEEEEEEEKKKAFEANLLCEFFNHVVCLFACFFG